MSLVDNGSPWECHSGRNLGSIAIRHRLYMVGIRPVSLDCTIYMLGAFAIEVSHLIGTCRCSLFKTRHNRLAAPFVSRCNRTQSVTQIIPGGQVK